jgi:NADH-quinone oxidoreductase subunit C
MGVRFLLRRVLRFVLAGPCPAPYKDRPMSQWALDQLQAKLPDAIEERYVDRAGGHWGVVSREAIEQVARTLKEDLDFKMFGSMDAVDRLQLPVSTPRFEVVYFFYSVSRNEHVRLKVLCTEDDPEVPTIRNVYQGANWAERLIWDFYGIRFKGHGDLRRLLMYEEFKGHPLRKDYGMRERQPLVPERPIKDIFRGPGTNGVAT